MARYIFNMPIRKTERSIAAGGELSVRIIIQHRTKVHTHTHRDAQKNHIYRLSRYDPSIKFNSLWCGAIIVAKRPARLASTTVYSRMIHALIIPCVCTLCTASLNLIAVRSLGGVVLSKPPSSISLSHSRSDHRKEWNKL